MSKLLGVAFESHELASLAGLASALGMETDVLDFSGVADVPPADACAQAIAAQAGGYSHIAAVSSMQAKDVLPRVAGLLDAAMVTDASAAESSTRFKRPVVAGSMIATVDVLAEPVVLTIRPAGFPKLDFAGNRLQPELNSASQAKRLEKKARGGGGRPALTQAKVVVSGGRPLKDSQTFEEIIGGLADALGGAVGATRAAVDSGIAPNELQVGQTGKIVAPDLYIAAGVSGSTQHMAGIKDSKVIVAINKDPDAPIFEFADFGLVADLYDAIPEMRGKLGG
jgi:electron transfer flavoprotein alpha subunit